MGLSLCELLQPWPLSAPPACHPDWPMAPLAQPQLLQTLTHCQKAEPSRYLFTLKVFKTGKKNAPHCCCLKCNWACKNIKAQIAWHVMKWERQRAERKKRLTKHPTSNKKMRGRKGEKIKQQCKRTKPPFHETCKDRQGGSVLTPGLWSLLLSGGSNDCHYHHLTVTTHNILAVLGVVNTKCDPEQQSVHPDPTCSIKGFTGQRNYL